MDVGGAAVAGVGGGGRGAGGVGGGVDFGRTCFRRRRAGWVCASSWTLRSQRTEMMRGLGGSWG